MAQTLFAEAIGAPVASFQHFQAENCNTTDTNAALTPERDGLKILTHDAAGSVYGLEPLTNSLIDAANFFKTDDLPSFALTIKTPADLTGLQFLIGLFDAVPDAATGGGTKDNEGEYNNEDVGHSAYFWFDKAVSAKLCYGYKGSGVDVDAQPLADDLVVSTIYELQVSVDADRYVHFAVDGVEVHVSTEKLTAATALKPMIFARGNAVSIHVQAAAAGKTFS